MERKFVTPGEARKLLEVSNNTLRKWEKDGTLEAIRIGPKGKHRRYNVEKFLTKHNEKEKITKRNICYARVSSYGQKKDLETQIEYLRERYPSYEIIKDIGSGINFKRKGFKTILDEAIKGNIGEVVVTYRDRLSRFGFELFEWIISHSNGKVVVLNDINSSPEEELTTDLISIITVFSARVYGLRKYKNKIKKQIQTKESKNKSVPN